MFSHVFLLILYTIELYIYTIRYRSGIIIPGFLQNVSKNYKKSKIFSFFKLISSFKKKYFVYTTKS